MNCKVTYKNEDDILIRTFKGDITVKDVIDSWEYLIRHNLIDEDDKGVISDFTESNVLVDVEVEFVDALDAFFKSDDIFNSLKTAIIIPSPKIVIPLLLQYKNTDIIIEVFSTMKAAKDWLN